MKPFTGSETATLEFMVTLEMTTYADDPGQANPVYSSATMARHFEEAGRRILAPNLEPTEDGVTQGVNVEHTANALPGMWVRIEGRVERAEGRRLYCRVKAYNELGDRIGHGTTVYVVMPKDRASAGFRQLEARLKEHREGGFGVRQYTRTEREA